MSPGFHRLMGAQGLAGLADNALLLVDADGARELPRASKAALGAQLVQELAQRLGRVSAPL